MTAQDSTSPHPPIFVSHPKSGRTWLRYVFHLVGLDAHFTHAGSGTTSRELGRRFEGADLGLVEGRSTVFMHRNPIDTAVSFYFQVLRKDMPAGSLRWWKRWIPFKLSGRMPDRDIEDFVLHEGLGVPKVCAFNRGWLDALAEHDQATVLTYEDARRDPVAAFSELFAAHGIEVEDVERVAEESSFDRMKQLESSGRYEHMMLSVGREDDPESRKVRRGRIGGYRDYLSDVTVERCREIASRHGFEA